MITNKGKRYNPEKESIVKVVNTLFEEPNIIFESGQTVWRAVNDYKNAKPVKSGGKRKEADFPDALVVNKALHTSAEIHPRGNRKWLSGYGAGKCRERPNASRQ